MCTTRWTAVASRAETSPAAGLAGNARHALPHPTPMGLDPDDRIGAARPARPGLARPSGSERAARGGRLNATAATATPPELASVGAPAAAVAGDEAAITACRARC